jgi:hypothetical protein
VPDSPPPEASPESLAEALNGRLASLVYIMKGRRSPFTRLGVLELEDGRLTLRDRDGEPLFAVPAAGVEARPARRRSTELHRNAFEVRAGDTWWFFTVHAPTKYERRSTRELVARFGVREQAPRPTAMGPEQYRRLVENPLSHQLLWAACWIEALSRPQGGTGQRAG